jgi:hypothetical protein
MPAILEVDAPGGHIAVIYTGLLWNCYLEV